MLSQDCQRSLGFWVFTGGVFKIRDESGSPKQGTSLRYFDRQVRGERNRSDQPGSLHEGACSKICIESHSPKEGAGQRFRIVFFSQEDLVQEPKGACPMLLAS